MVPGRGTQSLPSHLFNFLALARLSHNKAQALHYTVRVVKIISCDLLTEKVNLPFLINYSFNHAHALGNLY